MNLQFEEPKVLPYVHPNLVAGNVYRQLGTKGIIYFAVMVPVKGQSPMDRPKPHIYLINVITGERWSDHGFSEGNAKWEDITAISFLTIGSN